MSATLINGQTPPADLLSLYVQEEGKLKDASAVSFTITDLVTGSEIVSNTDALSGKIATGVYSAVSGGSLWTPSATYARAAIEWSYTLDGVVRKLIRFFEVVTADGIIKPSLGLCLIQDIKDAGSTETSSSKLWSMGQRWTSLIERTARQRFRPIRETKRFRGQGSTMMLLPEPCFGISKIEIEDSEVSSNLFHVYGSIGRERFNPRVELLSEVRNIYRVRISSRFYESHKVEVSGVWGFMDVDTEWSAGVNYLEPPREIIGAAARGAYLSIYEAGGASVAVSTGMIKKETTDGHSVEYAVSTPTASRPVMDILKDPEIADAIKLYRAPIHITAPAE